MDRKLIYEEVLKLEAGVHRKGFEMLVSAIEKVLNNPTIGTIKLYDEIAKDFNDTISDSLTDSFNNLLDNDITINKNNNDSTDK